MPERCVTSVVTSVIKGNRAHSHGGLKLLYIGSAAARCLMPKTGLTPAQDLYFLAALTITHRTGGFHDRIIRIKGF